LYDPSYIRNTKFVSVNATFLGRNYKLILNEPAALDMKYGSSSRSSILAKSGSGSWLDKNENGVRDPTELKDSYDIIAYHSNNDFDSAAVIISDPGLFINDNWGMMDNSNFVLHLINYLLPDGGEVIFDESRHINENTFELDARTYVDDLNDQFDLKLPEDEDYDTIGGFVFSHLGYIPKTGETFDYENMKFVIVAAEARKIKRLKIQLVESEA